MFRLLAFWFDQIGEITGMTSISTQDDHDDDDDDDDDEFGKNKWKPNLVTRVNFGRFPFSFRLFGMVV